MTQLVEEVPCTIMRGGTSKAVFIEQKHIKSLDNNENEFEQFVLKLFGSPDERQIDGLGGSDILTSKFAIIDESDKSNVYDVKYTFIQVGIKEALLNYDINCGNISSAVAVFAIEKGYVSVKNPLTIVKIFNTNTNKVFTVKVPTCNGKVLQYGDFKIDGVPGTSPELILNFSQSAGIINGSLFPTGNKKDVLKIPVKGKIKLINVTIIDIANVSVFFNLEDLGFTGDEMPQDFNESIIEVYRQIRKEVQKIINIPSSALYPFVIGVHKPVNYFGLNEMKISKNDINIIGRHVGSTSQQLHKAFAVTGGVGLATACKIKNTVPNDLASDEIFENNILIGHPSGKMKVNIKVEEFEKKISVEKVEISRTARKILEGNAFIKW